MKTALLLILMTSQICFAGGEGGSDGGPRITARTFNSNFIPIVNKLKKDGLFNGSLKDFLDQLSENNLVNNKEYNKILDQILKKAR